MKISYSAYGVTAKAESLDDVRTLLALAGKSLPEVAGERRRGPRTNPWAGKHRKQCEKGCGLFLNLRSHEMHAHEGFRPALGRKKVETV